MTFRKTTLKNGLRIITIPSKTSQAVTVLALVGTGSKYETRDTSGISHFLEHMYFKGTQKRPSPLLVAEPLDKVGGIYNAFTGQEYTGYFAKVESSKFELAIDLVSDIFLNSTLPAEEMDKEKKVIIEEINMVYDHPMNYINNLWAELLYGDQPAGWDIAGTKESVSSLDRQKLLGYRDRQYVSLNTILCVSGNVDEKKALSLAKKYFAGIKSGKSKSKAKVVEKQSAPACLLEERKIDQTHICLGVRAHSVSHPERYIQDILGAILGESGMMSSRLFTEVREKLGLAYYIATETEEDTDTGFLMTRAGVDSQRVDQAISTILKEYKRISEEKVSQEELKKARDNVKGKMALSLEASDARAFFYSGQELLEDKIKTLKEIFSEIDKITPDDILKVASKLFRPEGLNLAVVGPFANKERFQKLLKI